ncbi:HAMP domain-containing sensor histidine kinase [Hathewaya histolytica]|uniref:histidine kinase n=1 Tax=Hathewaya histolytica TaxID=1498 RepID=A0A4U9R9X6_HATHI|nr:HAMP domain-containing sensor histidine kinase [Hathewaya histolytica]VTQ85520.1 sensor histidine kinase [Hathewaya histolytica]
MKNKNLTYKKSLLFFEKYVPLMLMSIVIISFILLVTSENIYNLKIKTSESEKSLSEKIKQLEDIKNPNKPDFMLNRMDYNLWLTKCASEVNIHIYKNTKNLEMLSLGSQSELDVISQNLNTINNKNYSKLVKFIIIDKNKKTILSNDDYNIDFLKKNIDKLSKDNGELYNYISTKGKWYNLSYNSESAPVYRTSGNTTVRNPNNFIEAYWFPKDYTYSKADEPLVLSIISDFMENTKENIKYSKNNINTLKSDIQNYKILFIICAILFILITLILYLLGLTRIKNSIKNSFIAKPIKSIKTWFKNKSTLFKLAFFILYTLSLVFLFLKFSSIAEINIEFLTISLLWIIFYLVIMLPWIIKSSKYLDDIMKGSEIITSGDLEHTIKDDGNTSLSRLAYNINKLNKGFKVSIEDQIKNEKLKSELVANVSHDLKTPLTSIINYTDILLRDDITEEEIKEYLEILNRKSLKLKTLIEDLFEISKINSGKVELNMENVDVVELINQSLAEYSDVDNYINKNLNFIFKHFAPNIYMNLDGKKLSRVFENLITNALKYSLDNTRVYIEIENIPKGIKITFKNVSLAPLDFDKAEIFERFTRGDKSRNSEIDGSGLGLSIAKSIVELHNGIMYIDFDGDLFKSIIELYY